MKPVVRALLNYWGRILIVSLILAAGIRGMGWLKEMRTPPPAKDPGELTLEVRAVVVQPEDVQVTLTGHGNARAQRRVTLSSEVRGRIIELHPRLLDGERIPAGETLIRIDPTDYRLDLERSKADEARLRAEIERLRKSRDQDEQQLDVAQRTLALSRKDFERITQLAGEAGVRSESARDEAEKKVHTSETAVLQLRKSLELYPAQIAQAEAQIEQARAARVKAERDLERCSLSAPTEVRVDGKFVENAQYIAVGAPIATLVDDRVLEVTVPLKGSEAMRWLPFQDAPEGDASLRFRELEPAPVCVTWTQDPLGTPFEGRLARVERFDPQQRTVDVVVRIDSEDNRGKPSVLSEGMFCRVEIPGRTARQVFRIPRDAVTHEGEVLLDDGGRLRSAQVTIEHILGAEVLVSDGLQPGDRVLLTRPTRVIEGVRLNSQIVDARSGEAGS